MSALSILSLPGNKGKVVYLTNANNLKFLKKSLPIIDYHRDKN